MGGESNGDYPLELTRYFAFLTANRAKPQNIHFGCMGRFFYSPCSLLLDSIY